MVEDNQNISLKEEKRIAHGPNTHPEEWDSRTYMGSDSYTLHLDSGGAFDDYFDSPERYSKARSTDPKIAHPTDPNLLPMKYWGKAMDVEWPSCEKAKPIAGKEYVGSVLAVTNHHVIQNLGKNAVAHDKLSLSRIPAKDESISVRYDDKGHGQVTPKIRGGKNSDLGR